MDQAQLGSGHLVGCLVCWVRVAWLLEKYLTVACFDALYINIRGMQSFIFIWAFASISLHVVLKFSLHHATYSDNVAADAAVDQIVLYLTVNRFRHFSCIDIFDIGIDFLNSNSLEKWCLCSVLFWIENSAFAVERNASIRHLPLSIYESHVNLWFAIVALELNWLYKHFDAADSENGASDTHKLIDQMWLYLGQRVYNVVVVKADNNTTLVLLLAKNVQSDWIQRKGKWLGYVVGVVAYKL